MASSLIPAERGNPAVRMAWMPPGIGASAGIGLLPLLRLNPACVDDSRQAQRIRPAPLDGLMLRIPKLI
jgi:hypothetical protein